MFIFVLYQDYVFVKSFIKSYKLGKELYNQMKNDELERNVVAEQ